jgi:hypothetical protein
MDLDDVSALRVRSLDGAAAAGDALTKDPSLRARVAARQARLADLWALAKARADAPASDAQALEEPADAWRARWDGQLRSSRFLWRQ